MKILQAIKYYSPSKGGMEAVAKAIVEGITKINDNYEFKIYCNNHIKSKKTIFENIANNVNIIREKTPFFFKSQPISFGYKELARLIDDSDIIHEHYPFPTMECVLNKHKNLLKNKKLVLTWHANVENSRWAFLKSLYKPLTESIIDLADKIIVTSPQVQEHSPYLNNISKKIAVIPLSANLNFTNIIKPKELPELENFKILFVGKLREYKGVQYLIQAMQYNNFRLDIIGNGPLEHKLINQVNKLGISDRVFFHTNVSDKQLHQFYGNAHIFVLPSINEAEAFGIVQLEAMNYATPVINTNLKSGVPFVSLHNQTGLTVSPCNIKELSDSIIKLSRDRDLYKKFSSNCIIRAQIFTEEKMAKSYLEIYENL